MPHNSIVISSGHGKHIRGAAGSPIPPYLDEVNEARKVVDRTAQILREGGVAVKTFHDDTSHDQNTNLNTIVNYHNAQTRDLDVSVHFNANKTTSSPMGTEVLWKTQKDLAAKTSAAIAKAGTFKDRGQKERTDLFFLNKTEEPSILLEVCFVDSSADADLYRKHFEQICHAIAEAIAGKAIGEAPPPESTAPTPVPPTPPTTAPDATSRPTISKGDYGHNVRELQTSLQITADGDFGPQTEAAVEGYQAREHLSVDGMVGPQTWAALDKDFHLPPYPYPLPPVLPPTTSTEITSYAIDQPIADHDWKNRGRAPAGYTKGIALAYAQAYVRLKAGDPTAKEMAKADTHNESTDALSWYQPEFTRMGLSNETDGKDTLRHLFILLMGLGMRESSGKHCCGRDMSATNTSAETAEAGLYQTSWNVRNCCSDLVNLFDQYERARSQTGEVPQGYLKVWGEGINCSSTDWSCYGSGDGYLFQDMSKRVPTYATETCAIGLRNLRQHWGPINRKEAELHPEADDFFKGVEEIIDTMEKELLGEAEV